MKQISVLIKPASSLCNMRCKYCFYADVSSLREVRSFGMMERETVCRMLRNVYAGLGRGDEVTFAFQGGEPTLAGLPYFEFFAEEAAMQKPEGLVVYYALQTNGLLLDEAFCGFLKKHDFLVGLSLDLYAQLHDSNRLDAAGKGTYSRVMAAKERMDRLGVQYNVLAVLTNEMARHARAAWKFIREQKIRFVQFIPCLSDLEAEGREQSAVTPKRFAEFYSELFPLWREEFVRGNYVSIKFFDDLFNLLTRRAVTACGFNGPCSVQCVVEADGGVYPCDFYVLDQWRLGSLREQTLPELQAAPLAKAFVNRPREEAPLCGACPYRNLCGGGCRRMRREMYVDETGKFCGYREFLRRNEPQILELAALLRR